MKLLSYIYKGNDFIGMLSEKKEAVYPIHGFSDMNDLIVSGKNFSADMSSPTALSDITLRAPIPQPRQDVICLGINYMDHAAESARFDKQSFDGKREYAVYFSKRVNEAVANGGKIDGHFDIVDSLDYEAELAIIIGKDAKNVKRENVYDYIFGYTIMNDVSARTIQRRHKQWYFGKSLDSFVPLGPWIVTEDESARPPKLDIKSFVNGELRQNNNTSNLIFGAEEIITELSAGMTLKAGTIIATGTPSGVGMGFNPPKYLASGDEVECQIEGIGKLKNTIV